MADGTVRGGFELSSEQALRSLTDIRDRGREADAALDSLGQRMDRLSVKRVTPTIELRGLDRVNAQLSEIEARLDRLDRRRVSPNVGLGGGLARDVGMGGGGQGLVGGGGGSPLFSSLGGIGGALPWWAMAAPLAPQLLGGAGALLGSAGAGALGAGTVGLGALGPLAAGGMFTMAVARPAVQALGEITKAQQAYTKAVDEFGRTSSQAATAQRNLNQAIVSNPAAVGASRQLGLFQQGWRSATAPARANVYSGISSVLYAGRQAMPTLGAAATQATGAAASSAGAFAQFLAQPAEQGMLLQLTGAFAQNLPIAERSLQNIATVFMHLSVDAVPFFHEANVWVEHWTAGLARSSGDQARVSAGMQGLVTSARDWARLTGAAARDIRDLFSPSVQPGNSMVVEFTHTLDRWDVWLRANPDKVRQFFRDGEQGVSRIATVVGNLASDVWRVFQAVDPILRRAEQFISFASGLGGGSLLGGAALLYGGYEGARGALGGIGPSAGGALSAFVMGGRGGVGRLGGGTVVGGAPLSGAPGAAGEFQRTGYLMPPAGFQAGGGIAGGQLPLFAAGAAGYLLRGGSAAPALAARGEIAFNQAYGGVAGAHYAPLEAGRLVPMAERGGLVGRVGQIGAATRGAVGGIARIMLPLAGIQAIAGTAGQLASGTSVPTALNRGVSGALSTLTLGGISSQQFQGLFHSAFGADSAGASLANKDTQSFMRSIAQQASSVRTPQDLAALHARVANVRIKYEMSPQDAATLQRQLDHAVGVATQNAGAYASNTWENAFTAGLDRGVKPQKAVTQMLSGMQAQVTALGPKGATAFARDTATWASQLSASNPQMQRPLDRLMSGIVEDINRMNGNVGKSFSDLQKEVFYFNGQILTGAQTTWSKISDAMVNPSLVAQEKLSGIWGQIQREAINALTQMGFSQADARSIVTQTAKGGSQAAGAAAVVGIQQSLGPNVHLTSRHDMGARRHARGGVLGGSGLLDTVPLPDGSHAAPGEAYIANRHTMNDLSSATLEKFGKTAWQMIRDENRQHSAPMRRFSLGGNLAGIVSGAVSSVAGAVQGATGSGVSGYSLPLPRGQMMPGRWSIDQGVDIPAPAGTPEYAVGPGVITGAGISGFGPNAPILRITGGPLAGRSVYYGHAGPNVVPVGAHVSAGQQISEVGAGIVGISSGPHIEFGFYPPGGSGAGSAMASVLNELMTGSRVTPQGGGLGGAQGFMPSAISLRAPRSGLGGIPGVMADQASRVFAAGMQGKVNRLIGATGISAAGWSGGGSNQANQSLGHRMMLADGWGEDQWPSLLSLWNQESGWSSTAVNPSSGAYGIPQALGHGHPYALGDAAAQIAWGLNYIRGRYGSPAGAEAHERAYNWYQRGGRVNWAGWNAKGGSFVTNGPTMFGAGEHGNKERVTITPVGRDGGRQIVVEMHGVTFHGGDPQQLEAVARDVAGRIIDALDRTDGGTSDAQLAGATS